MEEEEERNEEEEGNADLTLGILSKAARSRQRAAAAAAAAAADPTEYVNDVEISSEDLISGRNGAVEREKEEKPVEEREKSDEDELGNHGESTSKRKQGEGDENAGKGEKRARKRSKSKKKTTKDEDEPAVLATGDKEEVPQHDTLAFRKVLRAPRYFDSPEDIEAARDTCYNCGDPGHFASECTVRKPCQVCGDFSHDGNKCTQLQCFKCGRTGHQARACPGKDRQAKEEPNLCLYCGKVGHESDGCRSYDAADLEAVQCYVCKAFGHLCCLDGLENSPLVPSCYTCGASGHTGTACTKWRSSFFSPRKPVPKSAASAKKQSVTPNPAPTPEPVRPSKSCFTCGEDGHFSRECPNQNESATPRRGDKCYTCGGEGHFARECPTPPSQCFKCGGTGHFARQCKQPQAKRQAHDSESELSQRTKLPRWMEIQIRDDQHRQQNGQLYHRADEHDQRNNRKQKPLSGLVQEKPAVRLPKWYAVESAKQR